MSAILYHGDCLTEMDKIPDHTVDAIIGDWPYGTTACKWDMVIPFKPMWKQCKRVIKLKGAIVLFGTQPFTSALIMSNVGWFKYCWTWDKLTGRGHLVAKIRPLQQAEDIAVFGEGQIQYYPIMVARAKPIRGTEYKRTSIMGGESVGYTKMYTHKYPKTILRFPGVSSRDRKHPTQKPVALLEYLIRTYTSEGAIVLDNTMGSGSTGVACVNIDRNFIGIEMLPVELGDPDYFGIAEQRVLKAQNAARHMQLF